MYHDAMKTLELLTLSSDPVFNNKQYCMEVSIAQEFNPVISIVKYYGLVDTPKS